MADVKNEFVLVGKVIKILPEINGEGKKGLWRKQEFVIETEGEYPKKLHFEAWNELVEKFVSTLVEGTRVKVSFNPESREYNEKFYTTLKAYKIQIDKASIPTQKAEISKPAPKEVETEEDDDLPF